MIDEIVIRIQIVHGMTYNIIMTSGTIVLLKSGVISPGIAPEDLIAMVNNAVLVTLDAGSSNVHMDMLPKMYPSYNHPNKGETDDEYN